MALSDRQRYPKLANVLYRGRKTVRLDHVGLVTAHLWLAIGKLYFNWIFERKSRIEDDGMNKGEWRRREFLRTTLCVGAAAMGLNAAERNIYWGLGLVTWKGNSNWPEILHDVDAAGFDGVEPFTAKVLNDEAMAELEQLLPKYKNIRMSSIYWSGQFNLSSEHDRLIEESHRILGYLKRFGSDRLTFGPPRPNVDDEKVAIANTAKMANEIGRISLEQYGIRTDIHPHVGSLIENPRQIDMLMDQTDPKYFNLGPIRLRFGWAAGIRWRSLRNTRI
jgi:hypothetical protein